MVNSLIRPMNLFLEIFDAIPEPVAAFTRFVLGLTIFVGLYNVVKEWLI